ncbi:MAG: hypothetical protein ACRDKL_03395 [Solirubrobacteraceae bacterium]
MGATPAPTALLFGPDAGAAQVERLRMSARALWAGEGPVPGYVRRVHIGPSDGLSSEFPGHGRALAALRAFVPGYRARAFDATPPAGSAHSSAELRELGWEARMGAQTATERGPFAFIWERGPRSVEGVRLSKAAAPNPATATMKASRIRVIRRIPRSPSAKRRRPPAPLPNCSAFWRGIVQCAGGG